MDAGGTCFVIMPYGLKKDVDGAEIDFDEIYDFVIKPAVAAVSGLQCVRCDDIHTPGWIHGRMLNGIFDALVAIVDTSTLNANVFYELGVRHALRKSVTVLLRRAGTTSPFNIEGMQCIEYSTSPKGVAAAIEAIRRAIVAGMNDPGNVDSLVYQALPGLQVTRGPLRQPVPMTRVQKIRFPVAKDAERNLILVTGDRADIRFGDVWVNSENTNMQMDRFYGVSTSATIRYLGAHRKGGKVVDDVIETDIRVQMQRAGILEVDPTTVLVTGAGALEQSNGVKRIFHVASVTGEPRQGYHPVRDLKGCVKNALREMGSDAHRDLGLASILFPIFGTGPGGGDLRGHAELCVAAVIEFLEANAGSPVRDVGFYVWSDVDLEVCMELMRKHPGVAGADAA